MPGIHYFNHDVFYLWKKHYCPQCKKQLKTIKVSRVVDTNSPEAKQFPSRKYYGIPIAVKKVKYVWKEFQCLNCAKHFTIQDIKNIEAEERDENVIDLSEDSCTSKSPKWLFLAFLGISMLVIIGLRILLK